MIYPQSPSFAKLPEDMSTDEYLEQALTIAHNASRSGYSDGVITVSLVKTDNDTNVQNIPDYSQYSLVQRLYHNWSDSSNGFNE